MSALESSRVFDLAFDLEGGSLPLDCARALFDALAEVLPWLAQESGAGVHPLKGATTPGAVLYLGRRAKLVLRLPARRLEDARQMCGATITAAGRELRLGAALLRPLRAASTLYAPMVVAEALDEERFARDVVAALAAMDIRCDFVCGKSRALESGAGRVVGYSLLLHGLAAEPSLRVQEQGLFGHRNLGCGIFVPHKSVAPVVG